jgi:hypothetical protein
LIPLRILIAALFVLAMCRAAGRIVFRACRGEMPGLFFEFVTGAAVASTLVFAVAWFQWARTPVLVGLGAALIGLELLITPLKEGKRKAWTGWKWELLFWVPWAVFGGMYLLAAMLPDTSADGTAYHVGLIARYFEHHGFYPIPSDMYSGLAEGVEMLFLTAFAIGRNSAAAVTHLLFLLLLPLGMRQVATAWGYAKAGIAAALLFYAAPVVGAAGSEAYIDVGAAAAVFAAFALIEWWREGGADCWLVPAGLCVGYAFSSKMTAATIALYVVGVTLWKRRWGAAVIVTASALAVAAPWLVKNALWFHNPFYPLFNSVFLNPFQYPIVEDEMRRLFAHMGDVPWSQIPWQLTVGGKLAGVVGPIFMLAPAALLALRCAAGRRLLIAFTIVFLPYFTNTGARFAIPALPFLALAMAIGIAAVPRVGLSLAAGVAALHVVLSWPAVVQMWSPGYQWLVSDPDWRAALRITPEDAYLREHWKEYELGLLLDRMVPPGDKVFSPAMGQTEYQHRELLGTFESALSRRVFLYYLMWCVEPMGSTWKREIHFPAVTTAKIRLVAAPEIPRIIELLPNDWETTTRMRMMAATTFNTDLRLEDIRYTLGKAEIPRSPAWRLNSSANPWEIDYAFDERDSSWWTSGRATKPGVWVETDFRTPVTLDRVFVKENEDQRWILLRPWAWTGAGWKQLHARETDEKTPPGSGRDVRDELKRLGVRWLLLPESYYGAQTIAAKKDAIGITDVAKLHGHVLWRLD